MVAKKRIRTQSPKNPPPVYLRLRHSYHRLSATQRSLSCVRQRFHKIAIYPIYSIYPIHYLLPFSPLTVASADGTLRTIADTRTGTGHRLLPHREQCHCYHRSHRRECLLALLGFDSSECRGTLRTSTDTRTGTGHRTPPRYNCISRRRSRRRRLPTQLRPHRQRVHI